MPLNRRTFLKRVGFSAGALLGASVVFRVGGFWWDQSSGDRYQVLSDHEARIVQAIADAMFPGDSRGPSAMPNGTAVGLPDYFDDYLASVPELTSKLLRVLLHAIDDMSVLAGFGLTRFHLRPRDERIEILDAWDSSRIRARQSAFRSIKLIIGMGYCEHPDVLRASGIEFMCGRGV